MVLEKVGGNVKVGKDVNPELAAAAIDPSTVVIQHNGQSFFAPMDQVDLDAVELACNDDGCVLIPDDGNPHNDIILDFGLDDHDHDHDHDLPGGSDITPL